MSGNTPPRNPRPPARARPQRPIGATCGRPAGPARPRSCRAHDPPGPKIRQSPGGRSWRHCCRRRPPHTGLVRSRNVRGARRSTAETASSLSSQDKRQGERDRPDQHTAAMTIKTSGACHDERRPERQVRLHNATRPGLPPRSGCECRETPPGLLGAPSRQMPQTRRLGWVGPFGSPTPRLPAAAVGSDLRDRPVGRWFGPGARHHRQTAAVRPPGARHEQDTVLRVEVAHKHAVQRR